MSRYTILADKSGKIDRKAVIGVDAPLQTLFIHAFIQEGDVDWRLSIGIPSTNDELWLGGHFAAFPVTEEGLMSIIKEANSLGYAFHIPELVLTALRGEFNTGASE